MTPDRRRARARERELAMFEALHSPLLAEEPDHEMKEAA